SSDRLTTTQWGGSSPCSRTCRRFSSSSSRAPARSQSRTRRRRSSGGGASGPAPSSRPGLGLLVALVCSSLRRGGGRPRRGAARVGVTGPCHGSGGGGAGLLLHAPLQVVVSHKLMGNRQP